MTKVKANLSRAALAIMPTCVDFNIPSRYRKTTNGQQYLLADQIEPVGVKLQKIINYLFHRPSTSFCL
ncbi:unnamed protein product [Adineta steineri]|uniref:Uncharacterized protein n=1 Tax=Adineta steineri TaxID=433720 RepID=A0A814FBK2_9BILA|nr:unnamed protein product [Adineta steineri]CAF0982839.1 unnamed protein product [Adineta steineri]